MPDIEYFYSAHSAFAYLGSQAFMDIARAAGRQIRHKPYDLRKGIAGVGSMPTEQRPKNHIDYFFGREIQRWAEHRQVAIMAARPTYHDNDISLPNCVLIAAIEQGINVDPLAHAMLEAHWRDDADLADADTLAGIAEALQINPEPLLAAAQTKEVLTIYQNNTAEAIRRSVFGSPTYFVDGDMFYGQDRLMMVERALQQAYR